MLQKQIRSISPNPANLRRLSSFFHNENYAYAFENSDWLQTTIFNSDKCIQGFQRMKGKKLIRFDDQLELPELSQINGKTRRNNRKIVLNPNRPISMIKVINQIISARAKEKVEETKASRFRLPVSRAKAIRKFRVLSCSPRRQTIDNPAKLPIKKIISPRILCQRKTVCNETMPKISDEGYQQKLKIFRMGLFLYKDRLGKTFDKSDL
jgi:hypothetical protein